jgi:hypothetical protein
MGKNRGGDGGSLTVAARLPDTLTIWEIRVYSFRASSRARLSVTPTRDNGGEVRLD